MNIHSIIELPAWERLFKKNVWKQIGNLEGKKIIGDVSALSVFNDEAFDIIIF